MLKTQDSSVISNAVKKFDILAINLSSVSTSYLKKITFYVLNAPVRVLEFFNKIKNSSNELPI